MMSNGAAAENAALHSEVAAVQSAHKKRRFPAWCYKVAGWCKPPSHADGMSMYLAFIATVAIPLWFLFSPMWNPTYVPRQGWVWSVPWIVAFYYVIIQIGLLVGSLTHSSEDIGMKDMTFSAGSFLFAFTTSLFVILFWYFGRYHIGGFQWHQMAAANTATLSELAITVGIRMLVNRRYFASVSSGGGDSN